ncbi:MAG: MFS transporter [Gemmataceae bacterium]|nr:MFS transporter [Gemmataceae bacterium]
MQATSRQLAFTLLVLLGINTMNFYDRQVIGAVGEIVRKDWNLDDRDLSALTIAFILLYAAVGLPLGHWADVGRRKVILAVGVLVWSVMTGLSGLAWNFASLFFFRLAVGVGEASCAPAANSLLGDLFPKEQRARALSVFMLGLPLGLGLGYIVTGLIAQAWNWRWALFVAGVPGLVLGVLALGLPDPPRGAAELRPVQAPRPAGSGVRAVLRMPTMWWIILSGALLNLNMYAFGAFLTSFLMRYHGLSLLDANLVNGLVYGFGGSLGLLWGGWLCDRIVRKRADGRLQLAAVAMLIGAPCLWLALQQERGDWLAFAAWLLPGCVCLYFYYASIYATIADIVPPTLRGTAMAVYFFVFYLFAAVGLYAFGWLSDHLRGLAEAAGSPDSEARALGLHGALHVVPALTLALVVVLLAAARTVPRDPQARLSV